MSLIHHESIHTAHVWNEARSAKMDGTGDLELPRLQLTDPDYCVNILGDAEEN